MFGTLRCSRCRVMVSDQSHEVCWYCSGALCDTCWNNRKECGHEEVKKQEDGHKFVGSAP